jgi:hypothetical protein
MTTEPTYYELLGVQPDASPEDIKSAFRRHAQNNHPDKGGNAALFGMLERAYATLSSPSKRHQYDVWLASNGQLPAPEFAHAADSAHWHDDEVAMMDREPRINDPVFDTTVHQAVNGDDYNDGAAFATNTSAATHDTTFTQPVFERPNSKWNLLRSGKLRLLWPLFIAWVVVALIFGLPALPGIGAAMALAAIAYFAIIRIFGSFVIRLMAWAIGISTAFRAHSGDIGAATAIALFVGAFALWMVGQYAFAFRHQKWNSLLARSLIERLPRPVQPLRSERRATSSAATA